MDRKGYNERLFGSSALRRWYHEARFRWLARTFRRLGCAPDSVFELGCFDGRAIGYLPRIPSRYLGCDANWEGGLDLAREAWRGTAGIEFRECRALSDIRLEGETFDAVICMDTLEHLPPESLPAYVELLARAARGHVLVTVPNEKGIAFAAKYLLKAILGGNEPYTVREAVDAVLCRLDRVARREHKGFDYADAVAFLGRRLAIESVSGIPFGGLPPALNASVGIVGTPAPACYHG